MREYIYGLPIQAKNGISAVCFLTLALIIGAGMMLPGVTAAQDFAGTPTTGAAPLDVQFTDESTGTPTGWAWYFGDEDWTAKTWTEVNSRAPWSARRGHSSVVLPDGSIVLMGGYIGTYKNDVWRSEDQGATWTEMTASAGWSARDRHTSVVLPDGSIVLMGGYDGIDRERRNDVWRSVDQGATWTQITALASWSERYGHTSIVLQNGDILLMGGVDNSDRRNDIWLSDDQGAMWTQVTTSADWGKREKHTSVVLHDGSILLMGGNSGSSRKNDIWHSEDQGATWTDLTSSGGWTARENHTSVVLPDGSILLMGGDDGLGSRRNDVWRSEDHGATWTQMMDSAEWTERSFHTSVVLPDGSIVLMGGNDDSLKNDVWRMDTATSSEQNPEYTYTNTGTYNVALQSYNADDFGSIQKPEYIEVQASPAVNINGNAGWRMMGVPVTGVTVEDLAGINLVQGISGLPYDSFEPNVYVWNLDAVTPDFGYSAGAWDVPAGGTTELPPGTGFIWYMYGPEANPEIPESKPFPLTVQLTGDEAPGDVSLGTMEADWHLIGNPFISDISFNQITNSSGTLLNISGQVWDPNTGAEGSYILTTSTAMNNKLSVWQGAFIELTSTTEVLIPQSAKTTGATFLKQKAQPLAGQVEFLLKGESNGGPIFDKAAILYFSERASADWDGYDVPKLTPFSQSWATVTLVGDRDGEPVYKSQHSLPYDFTDSREIPLEIRLQNTSGDFTLSWPVVSNLPQVDLWLVDRQTSERYNLKRFGSVDFTMESAAKQPSSASQMNLLKLPSPEPMQFNKSSEPRFVIQVNPESVPEELPTEITLKQNYPNPFNPTTVIEYQLPQSAQVRLQVYDMSGRQVAELVNDQVAAGTHTISFDAANLSSGVYMYRLQAGSTMLTRKLTVVK